MKNEICSTFTPANEPYLGRELLFHFDQMISCCLERSSVISKLTHELDMTEHQKMSAQIIPQSISVSLSIRELIRQGYLFGAHVLKRSLIERVVILQYLHLYPEDIGVWVDGWQHRQAPSLARMLDQIKAKAEPGVNVPELKGFEFTAPLNSLVHGKPDSTIWGLVKVDDGKYGNAPSKMLDSPQLCDELCAETLPWLVVLVAMMHSYFPEK
ncbi:conserved hypothetical protein [Vibrio jasicida]|uniref:hypothetical protein n=1 Tax=Vibrio jasicida TaxID=766224 RepID=UPI002893F306|nr:conserved hypothetical protein [Vibrio jasicida]